MKKSIKKKSKNVASAKNTSHKNMAGKKMKPGTMIEIDHVDVKFIVDSRTDRNRNMFGQAKKETIQAVSNVTLDIACGELVVLMGLSGSGKTSLLRTINGLNKITAGAVRVRRSINDEGFLDLARCTADELRSFRQKSVAMVFQQYGLLAWRSVANNVAFGLELAGVEKEKRLQKARDMLDIVGLGKWANAMLSSLSGGMQQRVGLARALATEAPILLMDEPFSALDPIIRYQLQGELLELNKKLGRTIVFVSHDLDEATRIADRIVIMKDGEVVQVGTPRDILLKPNSKYVKDFVSEVNPMKVLKARDLVGFSPTINGGGGKEVAPNTSYQELLAMWQKDKSFFIVKDKNKNYGTISGDDLLHTLTK
ncbi:MAG: ATP-binding cassette domain-containing protein [Hydrotalea sp.]|nr:ATP-binding cassette domain-containing protein [Hydrotalea sp.]